MAKLDLLPRKVFQLTLEDGTIVEGQFGTWTLKRFTDKKKITLSGLSEAFNNMSLGDAIDFILCAVEYSERQAGKPNTFNEMALCKWADDYGQIDALAQIVSHSSDEQKKSPEQRDDQLSGQSLSDTPPVQE